jgi:PAS domain S-box-containing protein
VTGFSREEALKMNIANVLAPDYVDTARQMLARKKTESKVSTVYELEIIAKDGRRVALEVSTRLIHGGGKPMGVQGIARDITARKGAEEALKDSEEKFRSIVETTNEWIWAMDLDGNRTYTNPAIEQILGYKADEILGTNLREFLHPEDRKKIEELFPQWISEKRGWTGLVLRWKHKNEGYRYLESNGLPVFDPTGNLVGYRGADRDITQRKLAEEALGQQAERAALTNRISQAVRRTLDVSEVFETAVRELGAHLEVDRCSLFMKDEKAGRVTNAAEYHVSDVVPAGSDFDLPQVQGVNAAMEKHGVLAFDDIANDERVRDLYQGILKRFNVKSIMYVGVTVGNELLGAFALSTTRELRHWSEADVEVAKAASDQTGIAIRQARLYQKAAATSMREALVNKLSVAIRASLSLTSVLDTATREVGQALSASRVEVRLYDATGDQSFAKGEYVAAGCESVSDFDANYDELLRGHFLKSVTPLVIHDVQQYAEGPSEFANCIRLRAACTGVQSQIDYPLTVNGEFRGVISIHQTESIRRWTEDEVLLVESVAAQLATGIAQAELFEMVARAKKEWESTFDAMSDGIFIFDQAGKLVRVNRAGAAMDKAHPE